MYIFLKKKKYLELKIKWLYHETEKDKLVVTSLVDAFGLKMLLPDSNENILANYFLTTFFLKGYNHDSIISFSDNMAIQVT